MSDTQVTELNNLKATIEAFHKATTDLRLSVHDIEAVSDNLIEHGEVLLFGAEIGTPDFKRGLMKADEQATKIALWSQEVAKLAKECMLLSHLAITQLRSAKNLPG